MKLGIETMGKYKKNKPYLTIFSILIFCSFLSGCSILIDSINLLKETDASTMLAENITETTISVTPISLKDTQTSESLQQTPSPENTSIPDIQNLVIWVPPQFDPSQNTKESKILTDLIGKFTEEHPGVNITFRVKAITGEGSALSALSAAKNAAPDVIPSLVILNRNDLLSAVQKGLVYPITTNIFSEANSWYSYAKQSSAAENYIYGIPIAGDTLVMVYRASKTGAAMTTWEDILSRGLPIAFVPASSDGLFPTFIYLAKGGKLIDDKGQPWLDQSILVDTLKLFLTGGQNGAFPPSLAQVVDQSQNWQMFLEGSVSIIISNFSTFQHNKGPDIKAMAIPLFTDNQRYPLMNTWNIAVTTSNAEIQNLGIQFAEKMADPIFNDIWTANAGFFPVRQSEHVEWQKDESYDTILKILPDAALLPESQILNKISPILNMAVSKVIKSQTTPEQAAQEAISELE